MQLDHLTAVELQLISHFLDGRCILILARCSHRTLSDMSSPFAWKHAPSVAFHLGLEPHRVPSLLRHASLIVSCAGEFAPASLHSLPNVKQLLIQKNTGLIKWNALLSAPNMQALQLIDCRAPHSSSQFLPQAVSTLPQLHTFKTAASGVNSWRLIASAPALTHLSMCVGFSGVTASLISAA